ncbi:MAG: hypothetical protein ABR587_08575, partial [Candidatus Binatia bacterium]
MQFSKAVPSSSERSSKPSSTKRSVGTLVTAALGALLGSLLTLHFVAPSPPSGTGGFSLLQPGNAQAHYPAVDLAEIA